MHQLLLLFFFLSILGTLSAQQPKSWLIYFGQTDIKKGKYSIHHEFQYRDHTLAGDINQLLLRTGFRYKAADYLSLMAGYAFVHTESASTPRNPFAENRIFQEAVLSHKALRIAALRHRFRLEQRFMEGYDYSNRARYCLFVDIPFTTRGMGEDGWYASFYDELFINLADNDVLKPFDRNRAYAGIGYKIKEKLGVQLGYMRQHVGRNAGTDHVLISVHHRIGR